MPSRNALVVIAILVALPASHLAGAEPALIRDINPLAAPAPSNPRLFASLGDVALLLAEGGRVNQGEVELWRSDGTAGGTFELPGCEEGCFLTPQLLSVAGRRAFFALRPRGNGEEGGVDELWVSNGSPAGTFRLAGDLRVPSLDAPAAAWVASRGLFFFVASEPGQGLQLWRSDGSPAGTFRLTGLEDVGTNLVAFQGRVYFSAGAEGALWRSDGTVRGTVQVEDPLPRSPAAPGNFKVVGNRLVFLTFRPATGSRLWCSDGTARGTAVCGSFPEGTVVDFQGSGVTPSGRLFFFVLVPEQGVDVAVTDGTASGTRIVTRLRSRNPFPGDRSSLFRSAADGRSVFFLAADRAHGTELWRSDGTVAGTRLVKDVCPGACSGTVQLGGTVGGRLYFTGQDETNGQEPWSSDGTAAGTRRIADLCPGACGSFARFYAAALGRRIPFTTILEGETQTWATDGSAAGTVRIATPAAGLDFAFLPFEGPALGGAILGAGHDREHSIELWRSDLTPGGTRFLADLNATDRGGSYPSDLKMVGETAYFFADDGASGFELWKSDGTAPGTLRVVDAVPGPEPVLRPAGNRILGADSQGRLYFVALTLAPDRYAVWRSDGSASGTFPLTEPSPLVCDGGFAELLGRSYFPAGGGGHGCELWSSDGTVAGTEVLDAVPGFEGSNPAGLVRQGAALYFRGFDPDYGGELWRSDGTEAGTARIADLEPGTGFGMRSDPVPFGGKVYFVGTDGTSPPTLWASDGTVAGTRIALPCVPSGGCRRMERLFPVGDRLWINQVNDPSGETSLLASDGTAAGTAVLALTAVYPGAPPTPFQGKIYFSGLDGKGGGELWSSDGTAAGTRPQRGRRGAQVVFPDSFQRLGAHLFFLASLEGSSVRLLWQTDGAQAGTLVVPGVSPTGDLGQPFSGASLAGTPGRLFLSAGGDDSGVELWGVTP